MRTLVLGGIRSGKSAVAEATARRAGGTTPVTYVATGPGGGDAEWALRVAAHRARRPPDWCTIETTDLAGALATVAGPVIIDCLGTWLTARLDALEAWRAPQQTWQDELDGAVTALTDAVRGFTDEVVLVSSEVGLTLVPENRAGRLFADWLGLTNQRVASACDVVHLVVAGQVLTVKQP